MMFKVFVYGYMTRVYSSRMLAKAMRENVKIESAANKYSFVWKRGIDTNERKLDEKLRAFIKEVDRVAQDENVEYGDRDLEEMGEQTTLLVNHVRAVPSVIDARDRRVTVLSSETRNSGDCAKRPMPACSLRTERYSKVSVEWGLLMIGYNIKRTCLQV
jgi:hypothetical protein